MRRFLLVSGVLGLTLSAAVSAAAYAQTATCEASADKDGAGEVIAAYNLEKDGRVKKLTFNWIPERKENAGKESDHFSRPSMILDYRMTDAGVLAGPSGASVLITSFNGDDGSKPPPGSAVKIRASAQGATPVEYMANTSTGEKDIARLVADSAPAALKVELVDKADKVLASSEFDLSKTTEVQKLATAAKADGDRRVAAFAKLAADGKAGDTCPAK